MTYTIPAGTQVERRQPQLSDDIPAPWTPFITTREVVYTDDDIPTVFRHTTWDRAKYYYFRLPDAAAPYARLKVRKELVKVTP